MREMLKNVRDKLASKYLENSLSKSNKKFKPRIKARLRKNKQILSKNPTQSYLEIHENTRSCRQTKSCRVKVWSKCIYSACSWSCHSCRVRDFKHG